MTIKALINAKKCAALHRESLQAPTIDPNHNTAAAITDRYTTGQGVAQRHAENNFSWDQPYNSNTNRGFLESVYLNETGRRYDENGMNYWLNEMNNGMTRDQVVQAFNNTAEGKGYDNPTTTVAGLLDNITVPGTTDTQNTGSNTATHTANQVQSSNNSVTRNVQPNETVNWQVGQIIDQNSPLMQRAEAKGLALANSRGLLNSTMAIEAAQNSVLDNAIRIATPDAATHANQALTNQKYSQVAEQAALDRQHEFDKMAQSLGNQMAIERLKQNSGMYAQFIQGMTDINASDMDQGAKDLAMAELWKVINQGTAMGAALSAVNFVDGQLQYYSTDSAPAQSAVVTVPTTPQTSTSSLTWGDGGIYTPGVTRNSRGEIVDKNGNPAPSAAFSLNDAGEWVNPNAGTLDMI